MNKIQHYIVALLLLTTAVVLPGCRRNTDDVWEDANGRHVGRGFRTLGGKHDDSRAVQNPDDFMPIEDGSANYNIPQSSKGYSSGDYVPLSDSQNDQGVGMADFVAQQPRETPGEAGSSIPGIDSFRDASTIPQLAGIFKMIHFEYNSNLIKGADNLNIIRDVAGYMKSHQNLYVFVSGHTDERGAEAYNLALGSRRANSVRNLLIQEGVNPDNIFTISYGKERPLVLEHHEDGWSQNRRAEFLIYQR